MTKNVKPLPMFDQKTGRLLDAVVCIVFQLDATVPVTNVTE